MPRKKVNEVEVKITFPVMFGARLITPGETAAVPEDIAQEWILTERAISIAEVQK